MEQKFKAGDRCRIIRFGHPIHQSKTASKGKPDNLLYEDDDFYVIDIAPDYVGKEVTIKGSYFDLYGRESSSDETKANERKKYSTDLFSWTNESQLELI